MVPAQVTTASKIKLRPFFLAENTYFTIKQQQQQSKNSCKMLVDVALLHRSEIRPHQGVEPD